MYLLRFALILLTLITLGSLQFPALENAFVRNLVVRDLVRIRIGEEAQPAYIDSTWLAKLQSAALKDARSSYLSGIYHLWSNEPLKAQIVLESNPDGDFLSQWILAESLIEQGKINEAAIALEQAHVPTDTLTRWGDAHWSLGNKQNSDDARADLYFTVADSQGNASWAAQRSLGRWWLFRHDDAQNALVYLLPAHARNSSDAYTLFLIASAYKKAGDLDLAVEYMERSDYLYGDRMPYRPQLAQLYLERSQPGDLVKAHNTLGPFLQRNPGNQFAKQIMIEIEKQLP